MMLPAFRVSSENDNRRGREGSREKVIPIPQRFGSLSAVLILLLVFVALDAQLNEAIDEVRIFQS
jgi:hypothetical protein